MLSGRRVGGRQKWNVPEPELTLFVNAAGHIAGYTIGNDMSSRSIEGENPLYLPQAKVYEQCAGLGPCLYVPPQPLPATTGIHIEIRRQDRVMYKDRKTLSQMKRTPEELVAFLYRECAFPNGCFLMTGSCLVPSNEFTLAPGDVVAIRIDEIGTLQHTVIQ